MRIEETICDQCGARKQKSNHWFVVNQDNNVFSLYAPQYHHGDKDYCSESCVIKALSAFIDKTRPSTLETETDLIELNEVADEFKAVQISKEKYKTEQEGDYR